MICPHCSVSIYDDFQVFPLFQGEDSDDPIGWAITAQLCPNCDEPIIYLDRGEPIPKKDSWSPFLGINTAKDYEQFQLWPIGLVRKCPLEVPPDLRDDFLEASSILSRSPKASAALTRRCLQHLLKDFAGSESKDLSRQIDEVVESKALPSDLAEQLDAVRHIGNFAAHPLKDKTTGEILPVEPHEAEWNLDVLEELFDYYFVKPERLRMKREKLNQKLQAAGKPPLAKSPELPENKRD